MQIKKFKLINDGYDGLKITAIEAVKIKKSSVTVLDEVDRIRKIPVSLELRSKIADLTYFFLNLTRHWVTPFNKYFDMDKYELIPRDANSEMSESENTLRNLWNDTTITGASIDASGGFIITGKINVFGDKVIGLATPTVNPEDDFGFYAVAKERLDEIADDIIELINIQAIPEYSEEQLKILFNIDSKGIDSDEIANKVMEDLADRGALIIMDSQVAIGNDKKKEGDVKLNESTGNIDGDNHPEVNEIKKEENHKNDKQDKLKKEVPDNKDKGTLASESDFDYPDDDIEKGEMGKDIPKEERAAGDSMENLEHSQNMGIEDDSMDGDDGTEEETTETEDEPWPE